MFAKLTLYDLYADSELASSIEKYRLMWSVSYRWINYVILVATVIIQANIELIVLLF